MSAFGDRVRPWHGDRATDDADVGAGETASKPAANVPSQSRIKKRNGAARAPRLTVVVGAPPSEDGPPVPLAEDRGAVGEFGPGREHEAFGEACPSTEDRRSPLSAPCTEFSELARLAELADCGVPGTAIRSPVARRGATTPPDGKFGAPLPASSAASADPLARPGTAAHVTPCPRRSGGRADRQDGAGPDVQAGGRRGSAAMNTAVDDQA